MKAYSSYMLYYVTLLVIFGWCLLSLEEAYTKCNYTKNQKCAHVHPGPVSVLKISFGLVDIQFQVPSVMEACGVYKI